VKENKLGNNFLIKKTGRLQCQDNKNPDKWHRMLLQNVYICLLPHWRVQPTCDTETDCIHHLSHLHRFIARDSIYAIARIC